MFRRDFLRNVRNGAIGALGASALSSIPLSYELNALVVPKLSYNPTIDQLLSDSQIWGEMLFVDMKPNPVYVSNSSGTGKCGMGFDDNNLNFTLDYTSENAKRYYELANIVINRKPTVGITTPTSDTSLCIYRWDAVSDTKSAFLRYGSNGNFGPSQALPNGFAWEMGFIKTPFNEIADHICVSAQIPNSFVGPGGSNGEYGIYSSLFTVEELGSQQFLNLVSYPAEADEINTASYAAFTTEQPIPEFVIPNELVAGGALIAIPFLIARFRQKRVEAAADKH